MKKVGVLMLLMLFLSGCGNSSKEIEAGMALRSRLLKGTGCVFDAEITADYGDKVHTFSVACTGDDQGGMTFAVTAPESIAGITGRVGKQGGELTFDETALHFDLLADGQLSPVSGPWVFLKTLRSGCLTSACTEEGKIRLSIDDSYRDDALHLDIWLEEDVPIKADIRFGNRSVLSLIIKDFVIT